jgi:phosphatidylethanolamine/phosphatidyl-N-methylethanolamine N-methyltransferase
LQNHPAYSTTSWGSRHEDDQPLEPVHLSSVIPDGNACLQSALRALKPGGRAVIFDKFHPEGKTVFLLRKFLNIFSTLFGTDINRRLSDMILDCPCSITHNEPSLVDGMYRIILLKKIG